VGWFRHLLGYSASEVYEMEWQTYEAYRAWMSRWLPHILYGSDAAHAEAEQRKHVVERVDALPGGQIVRAS